MEKKLVNQQLETQASIQQMTTGQESTDEASPGKLEKRDPKKELFLVSSERASVENLYLNQLKGKQRVPSANSRLRAHHTQSLQTLGLQMTGSSERPATQQEQLISQKLQGSSYQDYQRPVGSSISPQKRGGAGGQTQDQAHKVSQLSTVLAVMKSEVSEQKDEILALRKRIKEYEKSVADYEERLQQKDIDCRVALKQKEQDFVDVENQFRAKIKMLKDEIQALNAKNNSVREEFYKLNRNHNQVIEEKSKNTTEFQRQIDQMRMSCIKEQSELRVLFTMSEKKYQSEIVELRKQLKDYDLQTGVLEKRISTMERLHREEQEATHTLYQGKLDSVNKTNNSIIEQLSDEIAGLQRQLRKTQNEAKSREVDLGGISRQMDQLRSEHQELVDGLRDEIAQHVATIADLRFQIEQKVQEQDYLFEQNKRLAQNVERAQDRQRTLEW